MGSLPIHPCHIFFLHSAGQPSAAAPQEVRRGGQQRHPAAQRLREGHRPGRLYHAVGEEERKKSAHVRRGLIITSEGGRAEEGDHSRVLIARRSAPDPEQTETKGGDEAE